MKKVTTNLRETFSMLSCISSRGWGGGGGGDTNTGLALVGRNSRGTQARKQNIAGELGR